MAARARISSKGSRWEMTTPTFEAIVAAYRRQGYGHAEALRRATLQTGASTLAREGVNDENRLRDSAESETAAHRRAAESAASYRDSPQPASRRLECRAEDFIH